MQLNRMTCQARFKFCGRRIDITAEETPKTTERGLGEEPKPMVLMSKLIPEWIPGQAQERKSVMELPHIPPKCEHLIMIGASAAVGCHLCTETFIKIAHRSGVTKEEIAQAILATRFALASKTLGAPIEGMEYLVRKVEVNLRVKEGVRWNSAL